MCVSNSGEGLFVAEIVRKGFPSIRCTGDRDARQALCAVPHKGELCSVWDSQMSRWAFAQTKTFCNDQRLDSYSVLQINTRHLLYGFDSTSFPGKKQPNKRREGWALLCSELY